MQSKLRQSAQALFMVVALVLAASTAHAERELLDRVIAIVDDGVVLKSDLDARVSSIVSRLSAQGTGLPPRQVLEERVLDQLITETIQLQMAENMGMRISDNELNETMRNIAERNNMTLAQFEDQLTAEGVSYQQAREQIRREMLASRVQQRRVGSRIRVSEREVENYLEAVSREGRSDTEYQLGHILVAVDDFNDRQEVAAAREKAERLREEIINGRDFRSAAVAQSDASSALDGGVMDWRPGNQLPTMVAGIVPTLEEGELTEVLQSDSGFHLVTVLGTRGDQQNLVQQSRVRHILVRTDDVVSEAEAQQRINDIYQQLRNGADFATLAREFSDDPGSAPDGGELGWVSPREMVPAFAQAMNAAQPGELVAPFRSRFGWHVLEVLDRRQQDISSQVRESEARQAIYRRKFEAELQNWLREIRDEAYVEIKRS